ncbi:MAG: HEAT repeat domain-containing protein [Phycisphaerae bacterium]|nr:HEAT repeat domain-containing protein [Phycisphaerae bacterium]
MNRKMRHMQAVAVLCLAAVLFVGVAGAADAKTKAAKEKQLIETLKGKAPQAEKDLACRELQVIGTEACIDALAAMLTDVKLSHMARYALEPMPYPRASKVMRDALDKTSGPTKVGLLISLGFRRDAASAGVLTALLKDKDPAVAGASAAALGRIGTLEAAKALGAFRGSADKALQVIVAEASLTAAEQLAQAGKQDEAASICKELQADKWPAHVRLGAFVGLLGSGGEDAVSQAVAAISGKDAAMRAAAISHVSKLKGKDVGKRLAVGLDKLPAGAQALLIEALGDLGDAAVLPTIVKSASNADAGVRMAAIRAIGKIGDVSCVKLLCNTVVSSKDSSEQQAAVNSLHGLKGDKVNSTIVASMKTAPAEAKVKLIEALVTRKATEAVGDLVSQAKGPDAKVRIAALRALGWIAQPADIKALILLAVKPVDDPARSTAELSIVQVARKIADDTTRADAVLEALKDVGSLSATCSLLRVLGGIGTAKAFEVVASALKGTNAEIRDAAVRALSDWPDSRSLDALLAVIRTTDNPKHRVLAMRGCVRILILGDCTVQRTLASYRELIKASKTPEDTKLVLSGLGAVADPAALEVIEPFMAKKEFLAEAEFAKLGVARAIMGSSSKLSKTVATDLKKSKNRTVANQANWIVKSLRGIKPDAVSAGSWKSLFNGKDLTGWHATGTAIFKVEDNCLVGTQTTGKGGDIWTDAEYDNFELRVTYRVVWPANSGFWFRHNGKKGYQYDVLKYKRPVAFSGTLYCPGKMFITKNLDESLENRDGWNTARIRAMGDDLTLWLNGKRTGHCTDNTLAKGRVGIQIHPGNGFKGMQMVIKKVEIRALNK